MYLYFVKHGKWVFQARIDEGQIEINAHTGIICLSHPEEWNRDMMEWNGDLMEWTRDMVAWNRANEDGEEPTCMRS